MVVRGTAADASWRALRSRACGPICSTSTIIATSPSRYCASNCSNGASTSPWGRSMPSSATTTNRSFAEKDGLLQVGLAVSSFITVDDSGARHQGQERLRHPDWERPLRLVLQHRE